MCMSDCLCVICGHGRCVSVLCMWCVCVCKRVCVFVGVYVCVWSEVAACVCGLWVHGLIICFFVGVHSSAAVKLSTMIFN